MRISELYQRPEPTISFEYYPPKSAEAEEKLLRETTPGLKALCGGEDGHLWLWDLP